MIIGSIHQRSTPMIHSLSAGNNWNVQSVHDATSNHVISIKLLKPIISFASDAKWIYMYRLKNHYKTFFARNTEKKYNQNKHVGVCLQ